MKILNARWRIDIGLTGLITSLLLLAFFLGIIPDKIGAVREGRTALAESIAVYSTALVMRADLRRIKDDFELLIERNPDLLSLALRREDGHPLVSIADHDEHWQVMTGEHSTNAQVKVPIWAGDQQWGQLELRFTSLTSGKLWGLLDMPMVPIVSFMGLGCFIMFYFYLGKVLRHLDPSQAIPGRVRDALDTMAEGLLILDRKEQIVLANQAFATMLGKPPDKLLGHRVSDLPWMDTQGKKIGKTERPWVQAIAQGDALRNRMLRLDIPDVGLRTFKINCSPVLGSGRKYAGVLVSLDDVTPLEKKEVELRKSKEEAETANRAKSVFLANMSHDIRTPMNAILGFTEILKRGYVRNEKESLRYLNTIHSSGKTLLELINDILDLSKVESGRLELEMSRVEPHRLIHEVLDILSVKANEKGLSLEFRALTALPQSIESDPTRLRQVIYNIVGNAIKFTDKGSVMVTGGFQDTAAGPRLLIEITDTGIGMAADTLEHIFDYFVQADTSVTRRFGGTGLGLAISRKIARAMGGDITVESEPKKGSTFRVTVPTGNLEDIPFLEPDDIALYEEELGKEEAARWQFSEARVLVVDDGAENRELVRFLLEEAGLTVDEAENGLQCLEKTAMSHYDVILMDVHMPVMDGFSATKKLRDQGVETTIVALTANAMRGFEQQCLDAGYSDYFTKPINIDQFMEKMAYLLDGKRVYREDSAPAVFSGVNQDAAGNAPAVSTSGSPDSSDTTGQAESALAAHSSTGAQKPVVSRLADNPKLQRIILAFVKKLEKEVEIMEQVWEHDDLEQLARLAHWLKGAGGTVGFDDFTDPAAELEQAAKAGNREEAGKVLEKIKTIAAAVVAPQPEDMRADEQQPVKEEKT